MPQLNDRQKELHRTAKTLMANLDRSALAVGVKNGSKSPVGVRSWSRYRDQRPSDSTLRKWFARDDVLGVAIILGEGLCVRDYDQPGAYEAWAEQHADLAKTLPTVKTQRGHHVWFTNHELERQTGINRQGDGELLVGQGHMAWCPPSKHISGECHYRWVNPLGDGMPPEVTDPVGAGLMSEPKEGKSAPFEQQSMSIHDSPCQSTTIHVNPRQSVVPPLVGEVADWSIPDEQVERLIAETLPSGHGQREGLLGQFAFRLAGFGCPSAKAAKPYFNKWYERALPFVRTTDRMENWADFSRAFSRFDPSKAVSLRRVDFIATETPPVPEVAWCANPGLDRFAKLTRMLQVIRGEGVPFVLARDRAAEVLGESGAGVSRMTQAMMGDGLLVRTYLGTVAAKKASEYLYTGDLAPAIPLAVANGLIREAPNEG